jgi:holo-[acyl-carrier protein] synthase
MIRGLGVDIIEVPRMERAVVRWGDAFLGRVFTDAERHHAAQAPAAAQRLAGRFAAKEAVMKALGLGRQGLGWRDVEIATDAIGRPLVRLSGRAAEAAAGLGIGAWSVSISHTRALVTAVALGE